MCLAALRGADHPWRPWLPAGAALVSAVVLAAPALWFRRGQFSYASGLAIVLAGWFVHYALGTPTPSALLLALSASLAVASALWSFPDVRDHVVSVVSRLRCLFSFLTCAVVVALVADLSNAPLLLSAWLAWVDSWR